MNKPAKLPNKRKVYFIEKSFQARFILKFCSLVFLGGLLTIGLLYLLAMRSTTVSIIDSRVVVRTSAEFLLPILIQTVLVVMIFVSLAAILVTLVASHKIAGPLYRFKKVIQLLSQGDFSGDFGLRSKDQLQDLSGTFNSMIANLRTEIKGLKERFRSLKQRLDTLEEGEVSEQKRACLKELKTLSQELTKEIDYFKTE